MNTTTTALCHAAYRPEWADLSALEDDASALFEAWVSLAALLTKRTAVHPELHAAAHAMWSAYCRVDSDTRARQAACAKAAS